VAAKAALESLARLSRSCPSDAAVGGRHEAMQAEPNLIGPLGGEFLAEPVGATGK
jgi:hypothetical protein